MSVDIRGLILSILGAAPSERPTVTGVTRRPAKHGSRGRRPAAIMSLAAPVCPVCRQPLRRRLPGGGRTDRYYDKRRRLLVCSACVRGTAE